MKGTFSEIIRGSWEWTKTVLFRPFSLKKWVFLCVIAICAAEFSGCNLNLNINIPREKPEKEVVQTETISSAVDEPIQHRPAGEIAKDQEKETPRINFSVWIIPVIIACVVLGLALLIIFMWIYSRFSFVFLTSIIRNDASIKIPFRENKFIGNSFFKWNIVLLCVFCGILIFGASTLIGGIYLLRNMSIFWKVLLVIPWSITVLAIFIVFCIVTLVVRDLVLPVMFKDRVGIVEGWCNIAPIIKREKLNITKYILIKASLRILTTILAGFFVMAVIFALLIQLGVVGGLLYSASYLLPEFLRLGYFIILILLAIICFLGIIILINIALLPIPVYFRTFSLKFLARLDERYDLFRLILIPTKEGRDEVH